MRLVAFSFLLFLRFTVNVVATPIAIPTTAKPNPIVRQSNPPSLSPSSQYGNVLEGEFAKSDSRVPLSSCPQFTYEYLQVINAERGHFRIPHSRIRMNTHRCGPFGDNATDAQLLSDTYMELMPIDWLLTRDIADEAGTLGAYKKLTSKRPYTFRFFTFLVENRIRSREGPAPTWIGFERYSPRKCGNVELPIATLIFFGEVTGRPINMTSLVPRLERREGPMRRDLELRVGSDFHVTFSPGANLTDPEHVCPATLRRSRANETIPEARQCFPARTQVRTQAGLTRIADVRVGDWLDDGEALSQVIWRSHMDEDAHVPFVRVGLQGGAVVTASSGHLLRAEDGLLPAGLVRVGHRLVTLRGLRTVNSVDAVVRRGLYNPHTMSGWIVVDGVVASCYTTAVPAFAAHALLSPVRAAFRVMPLFSRVFAFVKTVATSGAESAVRCGVALTSFV